MVFVESVQQVLKIALCESDPSPAKKRQKRRLFQIRCDRLESLTAQIQRVITPSIAG